MEEWEWWDERNLEAWHYLNIFILEWVSVSEWLIWKDYHMAARLVILLDKKVSEPFS